MHSHIQTANIRIWRKDYDKMKKQMSKNDIKNKKSKSCISK